MKGPEREQADRRGPGGSTCLVSARMSSTGRIMSTHLTILRKGLILIAVPLIFQVIFIGLLTRIRQEGASAVEWTIHTKDVIAQAQASQVVLLEAHGAVQGLIITREPEYDRAIDRWTAQVPVEIDALRSMVSDRDDQTRAASSLLQKSAEFVAFLRVGQGLVHEGRMDARLAAVRRARSQVLLDELRGQFDRFVRFERDLDNDPAGEA